MSIFKSNLTPGQRVFWFAIPKAYIGEIKGHRTKITELEFSHFDNGCTVFYKVGTNGAKKVFYGSIKDTLYNDVETAELSLDVYKRLAKQTAVELAEKEIKRLQKQIEKLGKQ